ncbi:nuclear transport factor 2 family protein [Chitinophaga nivalis]|uniref:Nuclear transport factor 2 family protein n=1 Tax=Chitinophaga nivalis TaxID=2991709 RepID=A0ABT3IH94_9BACT|nr:nuclear transport factor 2 family protein [Chitinophaga nivalis]MCW3466987.1 nuclear transport factor 2 family protein [Chitinophaga nivalis]MCW3483322.1 nuclear transport factor 2 family protein [Chitinophaga nivalis]
MEKTLLILVFLALIQVSSYSQSNTEKTIRQLEQRELAAVHHSDTATLLQIWSKHFVVNNPYGQIVTVPEILTFIREGKIDYATVERIVDRVTVVENIAIAMGKEIVTPEKATAHAGKKVTRQYTNIWMKEKDHWRLVARQATIVNME